MPRKGDNRDSTRAILLVSFIFFGSGVGGLIYEVVWLRMLARIMGVTIYATSTVVAAFMAGLALGSFLLGRFIDQREDPLRVYAILEVLIGVSALLVPLIFSLSLPLYRYLYATSGENQLLITVLRTFICFFALVLPTTLMGGTLPTLTSWLVKRGNLFGKSFGLLYGINTLGAVFGASISGFVTLEFFGELRTILLGVFLNFLVAGLAYTIYQKEVKTPEGPALDQALPGAALRQISPYSDKIRQVVLLAFMLSGFTSLAYEVIWTRQLILFLQTSFYAFSGMLAVFLTGIALGSIFMRNRADRLVRPLVIFGILELVIGFLSLSNLYLFPVFDGFSIHTVVDRIWVSLAATVIIVFPLTFLFGMIFPTASVCYARDISKTGAAVGGLYSANTIGSIFGALLAGFWLIPFWGSTHAVVLLALLNAGLGLLLLWLDSRGTLRTKICCLTVIPLLLLLIFQVKAKDPFLSTLVERIQKIKQDNCEEKDCPFGIFYNKEGIEGTVTAFTINNYKYLWINGIGMTFLCTETKLMAHLPIFYAPQPPKEMLIICFGMGTVLKSATVYPDLNITTVELVPEEYKIFGFYHKDAEEILKRKNVHPVVNDGRNYILLSPRRYDIITVDPAPPTYSAGTVNLYTREFFQICKSRLSPHGVMCLWFPGGRESEVKSLIKTFYSVFPNMKVYVGPHGLGFYFIGTMKEISESEVRQNMEKAFGNPAIINDLSEYDDSCISETQLHQMFLWDSNEIKSIAADGVLITDDYPYTEFFLWRYLLKRDPYYQPLPLPMQENNWPERAGDAEAHDNLGLTLAAQGKLDQAIAQYAEALRLKPDLAGAHNNLGLALAAQGKLDEAIAQYTEALRLNPAYAGTQNNLGLALAAQGKLDQAVAHYTEALRLNPDLAKAQNNLGLALAAQGKLDQAVAHYAQALRLEPDYAEAHNCLGLALTAQGKLDQARAHFAEALRLKPDYAEAHNNLGLSWASQGKLDEAVAQYTEALRLNPDLAETHNNLGVALAKQGKIEAAITSYQKAIQLKPSFSGAYTNLGLALAQQGNIDQAMIIFQNALKENPNNPIAQKMLTSLKAQSPHN